MLSLSRWAMGAIVAVQTFLQNGDLPGKIIYVRLSAHGGSVKQTRARRNKLMIADGCMAQDSC